MKKGSAQFPCLISYGIDHPVQVKCNVWVVMAFICAEATCCFGLDWSPKFRRDKSYAVNKEYLPSH